MNNYTDWKTACENNNRVDWIKESIQSGEITKIIENEENESPLEILQDCIYAKDKESVNLLVDNGVNVDADYLKGLISFFRYDDKIYKEISKFLIHKSIEYDQETCEQCSEYRELVDNNFHSESIEECGGCE